MLITYAPEGAAPLRWNYTAAKVRQSKAEIMEKYYGGTFDELNKAILSGSAKARRVLLFYCLSGDHPLMKFADTPDFAMSEFQVEFDAEELYRLKDAVNASDADDETKASAMAKLDKMIAELPEDAPGK